MLIGNSIKQFKKKGCRDGVNCVVFLCCVLLVASFPGSPPRAQVYSVTFDLHEKLGGEPGEFYYVSDVKGREKFIARGHTQPQCVNHPRISKADHGEAYVLRYRACRP